MQHEAVIKDLQREIDRLRDRMNSLEQAKEMTESETFSKFEQQTDQLKSLKHVSEAGRLGRHYFVRKLRICNVCRTITLSLLIIIIIHFI